MLTPFSTRPPEGQEHVVPDPHFQSKSDDSSAPYTSGSILKPTRRDTTTDHQGGRRRGESIGAMGKRVDFSLGMSSISSGDQFGDVYDDPKPRLPNPSIRMTSSSPAPPGSRDRQRGSEDDASLAQTSSRDSAGGSKTHRNRFFSRTKSKLAHEEKDRVSLEDLEAGTAREGGRRFSIYDMPDIPEASGRNSAHVLPAHLTQSEIGGVTRVGTGSGGRIDPRTGIVSPQAVARDSALERGDMQAANGSRRY